jgi:hypothetical protein
MTIPPETVRMILLDLALAVFCGTIAAQVTIKLIEGIARRVMEMIRRQL